MGKRQEISETSDDALPEDRFRRRNISAETDCLLLLLVNNDVKLLPEEANRLCLPRDTANPLKLLVELKPGLDLDRLEKVMLERLLERLKSLMFKASCARLEPKKITKG